MTPSRILLITFLMLPTIYSLSPEPPDHLVPPPLTHPRKPASPVRIPQPETPGIMQRIARWFGFGDGPQEQQLQASYHNPQYKEPPNNIQYKQKAPCNTCNNYPWQPLHTGGAQHPLLQNQQQLPQFPPAQFNYHPNNNLNEKPQIIASTYNPNIQQPPSYAPNFNFHSKEPPKLIHFNYPQTQNIIQSRPEFIPPQNLIPFGGKGQPLLPIPIPGLSFSPAPPIYDAIPFRDSSRNNIQQHHLNIHPNQQIPYNQEHGQETQHLNIQSIQQIPQNQNHGHENHNLNIQSNQQITQNQNHGHHENHHLNIQSNQQILQNQNHGHSENHHLNIQSNQQILQNQNHGHSENHHLNQQHGQETQHLNIQSIQQIPQNQNHGHENHNLNIQSNQQITQNQNHGHHENHHLNIQSNQQILQNQNHGHHENHHLNIQSNQQLPQNQNHGHEDNLAFPTQIPPSEPIQSNHDSGFEIVKSVPLTDFVASVEYPINVVHSPVIDLSHKEIPRQNNFLPDDIPKLTELGSYSPGSTLQPDTNYMAHVSSPPDHYYSEPNHIEPDNYPEASSHNITYRQENVLDVGNYGDNDQKTVLPPTTTTITTTTTQQPEALTEIFNTHVEFLPSLQTSEAASEKPRPFINKKERQTPKKLLDSPILYTHGNSPRPFTKDPSDLRVHSSTYNRGLWQHQSPTPTPWVLAPTPTSTYTSLDASGRWAGISPPSQFQPTPIGFAIPPVNLQPKIQQIVIPYTFKTKPSGFKLREENPEEPKHKDQTLNQPDDNRYKNWSNSQEIDFHEQQESKLVTKTENPLKKTPKYLTKILASNIRDVLKREHEFMYKNKSKAPFDINKLQQNIDDWTEQEFTSLSHKASTLSVGIRSKNIPNEYLTTTPSLDQLKTTEFTTDVPQTTKFDVLMGEEGDSKKYEYDFLAQLVEDNHIGQPFSTVPPTTSTLPTTISTTITPSPPISPFYIRTVAPTPGPNELWNRLRVSISPLTQEKVYVVTPQPKRAFKPTTSDGIGTFKSPRFLIRPTPGNNGKSDDSSGTVSTSTYTPELFGLMGISAYSPPAPVETLDGHSKVITVVTPSPNRRRFQENPSKVNATVTSNGQDSSIKATR